MKNDSLEEKLEEIDETLSSHGALLEEIRETLTDIQRIPLYMLGGAIGWILIEKIWNFITGI